MTTPEQAPDSSRGEAPATTTHFGIDNKGVLETPLDFSFLHITEVADCKDAEPRTLAGKKKQEKNEDEKYDTKVVRLNNNVIQNTAAIFDSMMELVVEPEAITWIDLSFNEIASIDPCFRGFTSLQILYLHGNSITNIEDTQNLIGVKSLKKLSLHGNPIETVKNYKWIVVSMLPNLINFDMSAITKGDRATATSFRKANPIRKKKKKAED